MLGIVVLHCLILNILKTVFFFFFCNSVLFWFRQEDKNDPLTLCRWEMKVFPQDLEGHFPFNFCLVVCRYLDSPVFVNGDFQNGVCLLHFTCGALAWCSLMIILWTYWKYPHWWQIRTTHFCFAFSTSICFLQCQGLTLVFSFCNVRGWDQNKEGRINSKGTHFQRIRVP